MGSGIRVIVLCEDDSHKQFAGAFLKELGYEFYDWRPRVAPRGHGAASQWVREQYAIEVRQQRSRVKHQDCSLLVVIDADVNESKYRHQELSAALKNAGSPPRKKKEQIAIWVPRRNIETWVCLLHGIAANETHDYRNDVRNLSIPEAGAKFAREWKGRGSGRDLDESIQLDSLIKAIAESDRLPEK